MKENLKKKKKKFKIISNIYMERTLKIQKIPPLFFFYNFWRIMTMTIQDLINLINFTGQNDKIF